MMTQANGWIDDDVGIIDLHHQELPHLIAAYVMPTSDGLTLIETGPGSTLNHLLEGLYALGLDPADLRHILLTHIHLDHAGAAGRLLKSYTQAQLYVHELGARHMIEPERLLQSAARIYGDKMDMLWGEFLACPEDRVTIVKDGDRLEFGNLHLEAIYTPGHASHHIAYYDPDRNNVFAGDVAGVRIPPSDLVWPPTPPPDIDIEAWHQSIDRVRQLKANRLLLAHYGPVMDAAQHLDQLDQRLDTWTTAVERWQKEGFQRDAIASRLERHVNVQSEGHPGGDEFARAAPHVTPYGMSVDGLLRYLNKRIA